MASRLKLHEEFLKLISNVYFQSPSSKKMSYPCIRYTISKPKVQYADNMKYIKTKCYQVIIIDEDPDSELPDKIESFLLCEFDRFYTADNLNHWVFTLYF